MDKAFYLTSLKYSVAVANAEDINKHKGHYVLLKVNSFISLYGCSEASIILSEWRKVLLWTQERYFLNSRRFKLIQHTIISEHERYRQKTLLRSFKM